MKQNNGKSAKINTIIMMKEAKIISIAHATHDVMHIRTEKPENLSYLPGQAADISIKKEGWENEIRPFTFTSLPSDSYLEFFIKTYPEHDGVTNQISTLKPNDSLLIGDVFGDIQYKDKGIFIAGGAGITPFIAIFKYLKQQRILDNNKLILANKTSYDIIENEYFTQLLGEDFTNVLSKEDKPGFVYGHITKELIQSKIDNQNSYFYVCGPPPMMDAILKELKDLGIESSKIIKEQY